MDEEKNGIRAALIAKPKRRPLREPKRAIRKMKRRIKLYWFNVGKGEITNQVIAINKTLKELVNKTDKFFWGWNECCPETRVFIGQRGSIVLCTESGCHLWKRIEITLHARGETKIEPEKAKKLMIELLDEIKIKRFYDQDGCNGLFYKEWKDKYGSKQTAYCYINPFFKDGYFENHTLETQFLEIK